MKKISLKNSKYSNSIYKNTGETIKFICFDEIDFISKIKEIPRFVSSAEFTTEAYIICDSGIYSIENINVFYNLDECSLEINDNEIGIFCEDYGLSIYNVDALLISSIYVDTEK